MIQVVWRYNYTHFNEHDSSDMTLQLLIVISMIQIIRCYNYTHYNEPDSSGMTLLVHTL